MILIFDTTAFMHRALHVVYGKAAHVTPPDDRRFLDQAARMIANVIDETKGDRALFCRDSSRSIRQETIWADYKKDRKPAAPVLEAQYEYFYEILGKYAQIWGIDGYEADDLIATATVVLSSEDEVTIVSSDKDMMPLIDLALPNPVRFYDPSKREHLGAWYYLDKFGVQPFLGHQLQAMTGDSSDGIPGVPGLGPKTGAKLLNEFGGIDTVLAADAPTLCRAVTMRIADLVVANRGVIERNLNLVSPLAVPEGPPAPMSIFAPTIRNAFRNEGDVGR